MGHANVNDRDYEFRLGILPSEHPGKVYWCEPGWVAAEAAQDLSVFVNQTDKVVVERKRTGTDSIERVRIWDIENEWPAEAVGPSLTVVPWHF